MKGVEKERNFYHCLHIPDTWDQCEATVKAGFRHTAVQEGFEAVLEAEEEWNRWLDSTVQYTTVQYSTVLQVAGGAGQRDGEGEGHRAPDRGHAQPGHGAAGC